MWNSTRFYSGTTLFLIYINDLPQALSETALNLYANDTCIYYQHKDIQNIETILNKEFSSLREWFIDNELSVHFGEDKTKSILYARSKTPAKLDISFQDHHIKQYNCVEYLRCFLDYNLNGETMARKVLNKINVKLKFLYRQATFLNPTCKRILCNALIQPHFDYRKTVLGQKSISFLVPKIWSKINNDLKIVLTTNSFTHILDKEMLNNLII